MELFILVAFFNETFPKEGVFVVNFFFYVRGCFPGMSEHRLCTWNPVSQKTALDPPELAFQMVGSFHVDAGS